MRCDLRDALPRVRGSIAWMAPLGERLWFGTGGTAEVLFKPADIDDLRDFLRAKPISVPHVTVGAGSNVIIRDGGVSGVVIRLRGSFSAISVSGELLSCGAAATDKAVAQAAMDAGLSGLEFFAGIPGTIGGAVKMNAGAMGSECGDVLYDCDIIDGSGALLRLAASDLAYAYRSSAIADDWVIVGARFRLRRADSETIAAAMDAVRAHRLAAQPVRGKTGGSTFKNPPMLSAWRLIDAAACRGLRMGGAYISERHCNFMLNDGSAAASDLEALGEEVRRRVRENCGIELQWEIKRLGEAHGA